MDAFLSMHPEWKTYTGTIRFNSKAPVPQDMREALDKKKETAYNKGFVSLINPADYNDVFAMWNLEPDDCFPFLKFAFGHLIFFHDTKFRVLDPINNFIEIIGDDDDFDYVMDKLLVNEDMLKENFLMDYYFKTVDKLGAPAPDECYAFVPPLGMGGDKDIDNIQKVKYKEQLIILSQL